MSRRWFRMTYAANALRKCIDESGHDVGGITARESIRVMLEFMATYQPQHGESDELWCSWGEREGVFTFVVSRRMTRHDHPDAAVTLATDYRLTPSRARLMGERSISTLRDATATDGFRAIAGAVVLERRLYET